MIDQRLHRYRGYLEVKGYSDSSIRSLMAQAVSFQSAAEKGRDYLSRLKRRKELSEISPNTFNQYQYCLSTYFDYLSETGHRVPQARLLRDLYGAFPTDAYSHTPEDAGVQQPGMTGQVKEDILNRWAELGVIVKNAELHFLPEIFARHELLSKELKFQYFDFEGQEQYIELHVGEFAFTYCGLMIVYKYSEVPSLSYKRKDGSIKYLEGMRLSSDEASEVFSRSGQIVEIRLDFPFHE